MEMINELPPLLVSVIGLGILGLVCYILDITIKQFKH